MANPATDRHDMPAGRVEVVRQMLADSANLTEQALREYLQGLSDVPAKLVEAMSYSLFAGGKRVRPALVVGAGRMLGGVDEVLAAPAAAIECIHTFSLIHDDLPAMDDDDLRRGKPTSHKVFGEALAILAGDALLSLAFEILTVQAGRKIRTYSNTGVSESATNGACGRVSAIDGATGRVSAINGASGRALAMVRELATATGALGMIGGQVADMEGEQQEPTEARVRYIHERKTAALLAAACRLGAIAAGAAEADIAALGRYGHHLGLAFQLADDVLDATATTEELGKGVGKDSEAGKQTMVRLWGVDATMAAARREVGQAVAALASYKEPAEPLRALAEFVIARRH